MGRHRAVGIRLAVHRAVVSLGSPWGLFRHHWVLVKFMLTILATVLLLLHTQPIGLLAAAARDTTMFSGDVGRLQIQLVGDAGAALVALLVNVTLSIYKPQGLTPYGRRKRQEERQVSNRDTVGEARPAPRWLKMFAILVVTLILVFIILHSLAVASVRCITDRTPQASSYDQDVMTVA